MDGLKGAAVVAHVGLLITLDSSAAYPKRMSLLDLVDGAGLLTCKGKCQAGAKLAKFSDRVIGAWGKEHSVTHSTVTLLAKLRG